MTQIYDIKVFRPELEKLRIQKNPTIDEKRCLFGFPHPSGANGHRFKQF
ncbi:MAG: hypothetical protein ACE3JR_02025 [Ectobacillus sp.]